MKWEIYRTLPPRPANSPEAREFYYTTVRGYFSKLRKCQTLEEIIKLNKKYLKEAKDKNMEAVIRLNTSYDPKDLPEDFSFLKPNELKTQQQDSHRPDITEYIRQGGKKIKATPEKIMKDYKLRGIEYGLNITDDESKEGIQRLGDALSDLEGVLGLDLNKMHSRFGLGVAFGSRGSGRATAHYELHNKVINLTRKRSSGAFAHEWGHFLDNMLTDYISDSISGKSEKDEDYNPHIEPARGLLSRAREIGKPLLLTNSRVLKKIYLTHDIGIQMHNLMQTIKSGDK